MGDRMRTLRFDKFAASEFEHREAVARRVKGWKPGIILAPQPYLYSVELFIKRYKLSALNA